MAIPTPTVCADARLGTLYQRLSPAEFDRGLPPSLSMAMGAEIDFSEARLSVRYGDEQIAAVGAMLQRHGMARLCRGPPPSAGLMAQRRILHLATLLGARKYVMASPPGDDGPGAAADLLETLLETAREAEVQIVLENTTQEEPEPFAALLERIADPRVGVCLDTARLHAIGGAPPSHWFARLGSRLTHLHLSDADEHGLTRLPFGEGTMDLADLTETLGRTGHVPTACIESPVGRLVGSLAALKHAGLGWPGDEA